MLLIVVICVAFLYGEGMWSNAIRCINVFFSGMIATNVWEPLAGFLDDRVHSGLTFFWDFIALWAVFALSYVFFTVVTMMISRVRVRFKMIADRVGSIAFAVLTGWFLLCFTMMTLHTSPLARNFFYGGFDPDSRMVFGLAPDRQWLAFAKYLSKGPFSRSTGEGVVAEFDPNYEFINNYAARRKAYQDYLAQNAQSVRQLLVPDGTFPKRYSQ